MKRVISLLALLALTIGIAGCGSTKTTSPTGKYTLTISVQGQGTVTPASGLKYEKGTVVTLTPTPASGWNFNHWGGTDGTTVVDDKIVMDKDRSIEAVFSTTNHRPTVHLSVPQPTGTSPFNASFEAITSDEDGDSLSYSWDFGDHTVSEGAATVEHCYTSGGHYQVTVTVSDGKGGSTSASAAIDVEGLVDVSAGFNMRVARDLCAVGNRLFVAEQNQLSSPYGCGVKVFDISSGCPGYFATIEAGDMFGAFDVCAAWGYVYAPTDNGLLTIDGASSMLVGTLSIPDYGPLCAANQHLYLASGNRLVVLDATLPSSPTACTSMAVDYGTALDICSEGDFVYELTNQGLAVIDVTAPGSPVMRGSLSLTNARRIAVKRPYAYVTTDNGLRVVNVGSPDNPALVGSAGTGICNGVALRDSRLVVMFSSSLNVFDLSPNPASPALSKSFSLGGNQLCVSGNYVFVMAYPSGSMEVRSVYIL